MEGDSQFDKYVEDLCAPLYREGGRPSIPPRVNFRMLFVGYFEGHRFAAGHRVALQRQPVAVQGTQLYTQALFVEPNGRLVSTSAFDGTIGV